MHPDVLVVDDHRKIIPSTTLSASSLPRDDDSGEGITKPVIIVSPGETGQAADKPSQRWTRKRIALIGIIAFSALVIVVLVITLPVVLPRRRGPPDDPSYSESSNKPLLVVDNFPDPGLIHINGTWIAYGTNAKKNDTNVAHIPVATSMDFTNWTRIKDYDAMPTLGGWETKINHWAPDVIQRNDGKFVIYYSGELKDWKRHHCVGAAVSTAEDPIGPYVPEEKPLACPREYGGAIDPSPFRDTDGKLYVVYKADGNSIGHGGECNNGKKPIVTVPIMLQELEDDGITPVGDPLQILKNEESDGPLVEAPNLIYTQGLYYLFFSSHCFTSPEYDVKYAYSTSLNGPYVRAARPLLKSGDFGLKSPGGATVSRDGTKIVFHADCKTSWRCMFAAAIDISVNSTITFTSL
ncbi:glycosyl hydrolase [Aspergillus floccosus]